jgi:hypothetical protein
MILKDRIIKLSPKAQAIASNPDILALLDKELRDSGFAGDTSVPQTIWLATNTRMTKPVSLLCQGPSASGKTHAMEEALRFVPEEAVFRTNGLSPKSLAYTKGKVDLRNKFLYAGELTGPQNEEGNVLLRQLVSEGRIKHLTVNKSGGSNEGQLLEVEGPIGTLFTTTKDHIHPEDASRMLQLTIESSPERTKEIMLATARAYGPNPPKRPDYEPWIEFHRWVCEGPQVVTIPFIEGLAEAFADTKERASRDFGQVAALISAHALIHQGNRKHDPAMGVIAELPDYAAVYGLLADQMPLAAGKTVGPQIRTIVQAVTSVTASQDEYAEGVPQNVLAEKLGVNASTVSRWAKRAIAQRYLVDPRVGESGECRLKPGIALPERSSILPNPAHIA